jgi:hypothetical protein
MGRVMLPSRKRRVCLLILGMTCVVFPLSAQAPELSEHHGKRVCPLRFGPGAFSIFGPTQICGTQGYARVFTGTVVSVVAISDTEERIELIPDEVFLGDPISKVTATVNQSCLPGNQSEIQSGDTWLFYLRSDPYSGTEDLELPYYSPSKPLSQAQDDVATLRHLARLTGHQSIISGNVERLGETYDKSPTPVPDHKIIAKGLFGEYVAFTNDNGHFEFELPPDTYDLAADTQRGLREAETIEPRRGTYLANGACLKTDLTLLTDGKLAGRVTTADGKPASFVKVAIIPVSPVRPQFTVVTNKQGRFEVGGRQPGRYLVGIGLLAPYASAEWRSRIYYPGVHNRTEARVIKLGEGEWRTNINFKLPTSTPQPNRLALGQSLRSAAPH